MGELYMKDQNLMLKQRLDGGTYAIAEHQTSFVNEPVWTVDDELQASMLILEPIQSKRNKNAFWTVLEIQDTYLTPSSRVIFSTESYEQNVQTANSGGIDGISVVQLQSFSKYCTN